METLNALRLADEVRTFPSINMPVPVVKTKPNSRPASKTKAFVDDEISGKQQVSFPGLLKSRKSKLTSNRIINNADKTTFVGFSSANLKLDATKHDVPLVENMMQQHLLNMTNSLQKGLSLVDIGANTIPPTATQRSTLSTKAGAKGDETMEELKNYVMMMDKYSLHNFMIYDGHTLKETPEFHSFKRTYNYRWGAITAIIAQLEEFLQKFEIKLAIINGPKLFELSKLNLSSLSRIDLYSCISNIDQIQTMLDSGADINKKQLSRAVTKIQSAMRMYLAQKRFKLMLQSIQAAIVIQSYARLMVYRLRAKQMIRTDISKSEERFQTNRRTMLDWWVEQQNQSQRPQGEAISGNSVFKPYGFGDRSRLIIYIPSLTIAEHTRLDFEQFPAFENTHISMLYQLADPDVTLVYITPCQLSSYELAYHEKFLSLLGVSVLPKRLHFITPEMVEHLPPHLSLSQVLWCSPGAMNKLRGLIRRHSQRVVLMPATLGWVEKRLANYLNIPLLASDPVAAETVSSRSFMKKVFMDCSMNIPLGAHDIYTSEDLLVALCRLISSNIGVGRWVIRLNYDNNNDSCVILDVEKLETVLTLRNEQNDMAGESGHNVNAWYSRPVQLTVRKRIAATLKKNLASKVHIGRKDLFPTWEHYLAIMKQYGAVVEAEPIEKLGYADGLCFIDPASGEVGGYKGVEVYVDENLQPQSFAYPQMITPIAALEGATTAIAQHLFTKYNIIGHLTVRFVSFWDALDNMPRLWAVGIQLGASPVFGALGTVGIATTAQSDLTSTTRSVMPMSLIPSIPECRYCVYVPIALHDPLKQSHDDVFFKLCKMRGIVFDLQHRVGSLFFLLDSIVCGAVSVLCIGSSRRKAMELMLHTLSFISQQFGKDSTSQLRKCENLTMILINLKKVLKNDKNCN